MKKILFVLFFFYQFYTYGQLQENFLDGNINQDPAWIGDTDAFRVNGTQQLQSNGPAETNTTLQLATPSQAIIGTSWEFYINLNLATSSGNYADIFLISDSANFKGNNSGYFVRIGGTPDEVSLFRKDGANAPIYIINGRDGTVGKSGNNQVRVKVTRDLQANWTLWVDESGTGQAFVSEGSAREATYGQSNYFGILLRYSAANNQKFFFDDFVITDQTVPAIKEAKLINNRSLAVQFNEPVSLSSSEQKGNYFVNNGAGAPASAKRDTADHSLVYLEFNQPIAAGVSTLSVSGIADLYGNQILTSVAVDFSYIPPVTANYRDVRINEVMVDYNPPVNLPEAEFIELYNSSNKTFNLAGWQYSDATAATATLPDFTFTPGSYVILCRITDTSAFASYGNVIGLSSFPALNDSGDEVEILDNTGKLIDKIAYTTGWYQDAAKAIGGWSLELINPLTPCGNSENFTAAMHPDGGTPGKQNSVYNTTPDTQPPTLSKAEIVAANQVKLIFSESLDSLTAANPALYAVSPGLTITNVNITGPDNKEIILTLSGNLQTRQVYNISVRNIKDCAGNSVNAEVTATLVLPEPAVTGDIVINEILFNPRSGGADFVELVNRSPKYISLKNWQLGNIRPDSASDSRNITPETFILGPQQYVVLTTRPDVVQKQYPAANKQAFLQINTLPSYPDDAGTVTILDADRKIIDQFAYDEKMHFKLLDDVNGVSLERIRLDADSSAGNWHSAASTVGFATPGYRNSQYYEATAIPELFTIEPKIFTPDGNGDKDFTTISYRTEASGQMANITIFDANGREIKRLVKNELLANQGFFRWDGLDERGYKVPIGYYVLFIELFDLKGKVKAYKETVVVGARFD